MTLFYTVKVYDNIYVYMTLNLYLPDTKIY